MNKIIDYKIISVQNVDSMQWSVREDINKGWQPLGGPFIRALGTYQAMVKYENSSYKNIYQPVKDALFDIKNDR